MPYLSTRGLYPKIGKPFGGMLDDDGGRSCLPVTAELISEWWIKIGADDWRQILSCRSENGMVYNGITPSPGGVAERVRAQRLPRRPSRQAARCRPRWGNWTPPTRAARGYWRASCSVGIEIAQAAPARTRADDGETAHD